jgi:SOS response associated peptidase (SRAP)
MRWGLVPFWAKDMKVGFTNINAKAEGIDTKPAFREALSGGAASFHSIAFMNGRSSARNASPMRSGSRIAG